MSKARERLNHGLENSQSVSGAHERIGGALGCTHLRELLAPMATTAMQAMGGVLRSRGRGALYQDFQWVFGLHGLSHIGASLVTKGYTTGVLSSPTVVLPQFAYVMRALDQAQVPHRIHPVRAISRVAGWLAVSHLTGYIVSRGRRTAR
mgnify:CR=1 FL=1